MKYEQVFSHVIFLMSVCLLCFIINNLHTASHYFKRNSVYCDFCGLVFSCYSSVTNSNFASFIQFNCDVFLNHVTSIFFSLFNYISFIIGLLFYKVFTYQTVSITIIRTIKKKKNLMFFVRTKVMFCFFFK